MSKAAACFVRGGVYRVVKEALGGTLAKFSVSALMFDYVLTGPISGVSAGQYLAGLVNELLAYFHAGHRPPREFDGSVFFAVIVTLYFWYENIKGIPESSHKALRIMQVTTVMVALLIVWCTYTVLGARRASSAVSLAFQYSVGQEVPRMALRQPDRENDSDDRGFLSASGILSWP